MADESSMTGEDKELWAAAERRHLEQEEAWRKAEARAERCNALSWMTGRLVIAVACVSVTLVAIWGISIFWARQAPPAELVVLGGIAFVGTAISAVAYHDERRREVQRHAANQRLEHEYPEFFEGRLRSRQAMFDAWNAQAARPPGPAGAASR